MHFWHRSLILGTIFGLLLSLYTPMGFAQTPEACDWALQDELPFNRIHSLEDARQQMRGFNSPTHNTRKAIDYVLQHQFSSYDEVISTFRFLFMTIVNLSWRFHAFIDQATNDRGFSGPGTLEHPVGLAMLVRKNGDIFTGGIEDAENRGPYDPPTYYQINPANFKFKGKVKILTAEEYQQILKSKVLQIYEKN